MQSPKADSLATNLSRAGVPAAVNTYQREVAGNNSLVAGVGIWHHLE